jgi:hypothetical protein
MYNFKRLEELLWFGGVAAVVFVLQLVAELDPEVVLQDWKAYVIAAGAGAARAFAAAILARVRSREEVDGLA